MGGLGINNLFGGVADDTLFGGSDTLTVGRGHDALKGGAGADRFIFVGNIGQAIATKFHNPNDSLDFSGQGQVHDFAVFAAISAQIGTDVVLSQRFGNQLKCQDATPAQFDSSDFIF